MSAAINDSKTFKDYVAKRIRVLFPDFNVKNCKGKNLLVNWWVLHLNDLERSVELGPQPKNEIVDHYLQNLFDSLRNPLQDIYPARIMPRIQPVSIFNRLNRDKFPHIPFANGTVMVFVQDYPDRTISIDTNHLAKLNITVEKVKALALRNLEQCTPELEIKLVRGKEGRKAFISPSDDGYVSSRLCLTDLWKTLSGHLGGEFYAAIPARDRFVAFSTGPKPFVKKMRAQIAHDHKTLPYPITPKLFSVTESGISGLEEPTIS